MGDVPLVVRVAANLDQLRANLLEGVNQIETTSTAMRQMATAYDGSRAISQAGAVMAAIQAVGGATHLTADEQAKANAVLDAAIQKYAALGQTAPPGMQALADATKHASDSLGDWVGKFDIQKAISDPIGTAKEGMLAFVETLGPAGVALAGAAAGAIAVGAGLYEMATKAAEAGEAANLFGLITGTAIEKVGAIGATAVITGGSLDGLQAMLFQMTKRLEATGEPATKFDAALVDLGINAAAFRAADPSDRINILSDGMQAAAGSTNLMADAIAILGKGASQHMQFLMENTEAVRAKAAELAYVWSDDDTAASEEFNHAVKELGVGVDTLATSIGVALLPAMTKVVEGIERIGVAVVNVTGIPGYVALFHALTGAMGETDLTEQSLLATMDTANRLFTKFAAEGYNAADATTEVATAMLALGYKEQAVATATGMTVTAVQLLKVELKESAIVADAYADAWARITAGAGNAYLDDVTQATQRLIAQEKDEGASIADLALAWDLAPAKIERIVEAQKKESAELVKFTAAVADVASAGKTWQGTIDSISGAVVEQMRDLTAAGVAIKTLETYYGLTATQGKAFTDMLKDEGEQLKTQERIWAELQKVSDEYYKVVNAASHDTVQRQIDDAYLAADARIAAMYKAKSYSVDAELLIWQAADQTATNILAKTLESDVHSREHFGLLADQAKIAYEFAQAHADSYTADWIQKLRDAADAAQLAFNAFGTSADTALAKVDGHVTATTSLVKGLLDNLKGGTVGGNVATQTADFGAGSGQFVRGSLPAGVSDYMNMIAGSKLIGFAEGGPVQKDGPIYAHAGEYVVPRSAVSAGSGGGGGLTLNIQVTQPLGTPQALTSAISAAVVTILKAQGYRAPSGA